MLAIYERETLEGNYFAREKKMLNLSNIGSGLSSSDHYELHVHEVVQGGQLTAMISIQ